MTVRCQNGHEIPLRPVVGRNIPALHCWQCVFPPEEATMTIEELRAEVARLRREADAAALVAMNEGGVHDEDFGRNIARVVAFQQVLDLIDGAQS